MTGISLSYPAFENFFAKLKQTVKRPTIVVVFGDHMPGFDESFCNKIFAKDLMNSKGIIYRTQYLIWANYKLPNPNQFRSEMKLFELGRRATFAAGALPYSSYIYLFDKLKNSKKLMDKKVDPSFIQNLFKQTSVLENDIDPFFRMYHVLCHEDFQPIKSKK